MSKREAEFGLEVIKAMIKCWCSENDADARLEVCYHADMDDDDSDGE